MSRTCILCVSASVGFGVTDPGERAQTRKALEQASTLLLPTFRDLHNEGALELLRLSRFVRQGRARVEAAATNVVPDTGRVEVQDNQAEEQTEAEEQQLVLMSYPENKGHKLASVKVGVFLVALGSTSRW